MDEMNLLKSLYEQQTSSCTAQELTYSSIDSTPDNFNRALTNLEEHGYVTKDATTGLHITQKGCMLAKEL